MKKLATLEHAYAAHKSIDFSQEGYRMAAAVLVMGCIIPISLYHMLIVFFEGFFLPRPNRKNRHFLRVGLPALEKGDEHFLQRSTAVRTLLVTSSSHTQALVPQIHRRINLHVCLR